MNEVNRKSDKLELDKPEWNKLEQLECAARSRTPWGPVESAQAIASGVTFVQTQGHGGLILNESRWESLPEDVRACMMNPRYAEEDCEMQIVMAMLGIETGKYLPYALRTAGSFETYAAAMPHLELLAQQT